MTEIPEHLLKRSRERREALGLSEPSSAPTAAPATGASTAVAPAASTPATRPAAAPAPTPPPPPKPPPPYVQAAYRRKRIPWWAMPVLAGLPLWAGVYAFTLEEPSAEADALTLGEEIYTSAGCSSCHGATGGGGSGPAFAGGAIGETFGDFNEQIEWVKLGSAGWPEATYGDADTPVGAVGQMPAFEGSLSEEELALVVRYEREVLGGLEPEPELVALTEGEGAASGGEAEAEGGSEPGGEGEAGGGSGGGETTGGG